MRVTPLNIDRRNQLSLTCLVSEDFTLNVTPSMPLGYYGKINAPAEAGAVVTVPMRYIADEWVRRAIFGPLYWNARVLKRVVAIAGDVISAHGVTIFVNGAPIAERWPRQRWRDEFECEIPYWSGHRVLTEGEVFMLGDGGADHDMRYSLDGRYIGPMSESLVEGVWTLVA